MEPPHSDPLILTGEPLSLADVEAVASVFHGRKRSRQVQLAPVAAERIAAGRRDIEAAVADGRPHYGLNTGFGSFARQRISAGDLRDLQRNLIRSHAAGVGAPLPEDVVRGMMLLLAASLCRGHSGVRQAVVDQLIALLNRGVTPVVPSIGSCGASGDLAPLAHVGLVLIGEGRAVVDGRELGGAEALAAAGVSPLILECKEGLAIINGTHLMAARGALVVQDFCRVFEAALIAAAMSIDACRATDAFLDDRVHQVRNQPGQIEIATRLRELLRGSQIIPSHRDSDPRVQDPYSLRCAPQVLGAVWDTVQHVRRVVEAELGGVTDNPLVFPPTASTGQAPAIISAGNFHGMPLALALDTLAIAVAHTAGIAERRVYHMLAAGAGADPDAGLPPFLSPAPGLHSGLMIAQYTAAACCNELIGLANPASVANLSTSAGMEDYNSWGPRSAAKAARGVELCRSVVAIELLCAAEALDHHRPLRSGDAVERAHAAIRSVVPKLAEDRPPAPDIEAIEGLIASGAIRAGP